MRPHLEIFFNGEMLKHLAALDDLNDPFSGNIRSLFVVNPLALKLDGPIGHFSVFHLQQPGDGLERCAFSSAVSAKKGNDPSRRHVDGNPLEDQNNLVILDLNIFDAEYSLGCLQEIPSQRSLS